MSNINRIAGVDEAGRGPLAGPVFAAAVILNEECPIVGLDDSKKLSPKRRAELESDIKQNALSWSVAAASVEEIDAVNILQAALLAMKRALEGLHIQPRTALIDGNKVPDMNYHCTAVVGGDAVHKEISAASILAKEARDREMTALGEKYPQYGFEKHKGYPTEYHLRALKIYGAIAHHRRSFSPVRDAIENG